MKTKAFFILIFSITFSVQSFPQSFVLGIFNGNGVNILDVEESEGWELADWNTYSNMTSLEGLIKLSDKLLVGGEIGAHRLYYWERQNSLTGYWNWNTLWTYNIGALAESFVTDKFTLKTGVGARIYSDGSGVAFGGMAALDYAILSFGKIKVPLGVRTDFIPASAFTISVNVTIGLRFVP